MHAKRHPQTRRARAFLQTRLTKVNSEPLAEVLQSLFTPPDVVLTYFRYPACFVVESQKTFEYDTLVSPGMKVGIACRCGVEKPGIRFSLSAPHRKQMALHDVINHDCRVERNLDGGWYLACTLHSDEDRFIVGICRCSCTHGI
jgi:hypothetical protein